MFKYVVFIVILLLVILLVVTLYVSKPLYSEDRSDMPPLSAIAPVEKALTFARTSESLYLVKEMLSDSIEGINLSSLYESDLPLDPIELYNTMGYDSIAEIKAPPEVIALNQLELPADFGSTHLAAGTNYKEHSEEVMLDDPPFLFPKNVLPTPWNASVQFTKRLDYEAELSAVPLSSIKSPEEIPTYGLILTNDFTDRWRLIKGLKLRKPMGTTGFAAAKGQMGYLPTGAFLVIPKDEDFYKEIELRLYVNDKLRQRFKAADMILNIDDMVAQSFVDRENVYFNGSEEVDLIPNDGIGQGSMILTGTAGGVIFKPTNIWWQGIYLKRGDVIRTEASYLGSLLNKIE